MPSEITTTRELATVAFEEIELAHVKLKNSDTGHYEQGRIISRFNDDVTLLYRGHEATVTNVTDWTLRRFEPVRSDLQRTMIKGELEGYE